ncbi:MAG: hypothetical protein AAFW98_00785 [Pseudomonadota bacterium]
MSDLVDKGIREVIARHDAFVTWFTGGGDDTVWAEMEKVFAPGFVLISPDASIARHADVMAMLRGARGKRAADFAISITDAHPLWTTDDAVVIAYVERQTVDGKNTARQSTALFTRDDTAPGGVLWQHVHETWIDNGESP